jgi:zinc protease
VARVDPNDKVVPLDARVVSGRLPNGLTYYVMPHRKPEKRAYLRLVVNAGSVLEDDDQQGLAHFVEHMGFNGTRRFPKHEITNFVEKAGMSFGAHLNAFTGFDDTTYVLKVPTDDAALLQRSFEVLRDWAGDVSFDPAEIERERAVVLEERRRGRGAGRRLFEKSMPALYGNSLYARRLPIGQPDVIAKALPATIRRFYKDWYRPDLMAVIAVGDFEPAQIVATIEREFASLASPSPARQRPTVAVPSQGEALISIEADAEMPRTTVAVGSVVPNRSGKYESDFRRRIGERLFHMMLNDRLAEIRRQPDAPFLAAGSSTSSLTRAADAFWLSGSAKDGAGQVERATSALLQELVRVERHGFTETELARVKTALLRYARQAVLERDKRDGGAYAGALSRHFLEDEAVPGEETYLALAERFVPTFTPAELAQVARSFIGGGRPVVIINGPDAAKLPTPAAVTALVSGAASTAVTAYDDGAARGPLLATEPSPGKVVESKSIADIGVTEWRLANGVRVVVKPTTFNNAQVMLRAFSPGGSSLVKDNDFDEARMAPGIAWAAGIGPFDRTALDKYFRGSMLSIDTDVDELEETVSASGTPEVLTAMFELVHLAFTGVREDEDSFRAWQQRVSEGVRNRRLSPVAAFNEDFALYLTRNHFRRRPATPETIAAIDRKRAVEIYRERFGDAGDFTFVIVGNVELGKLQPLVETYLGSLPSKQRKETFRDVGIDGVVGPAEKVVKRGIEPKSQVRLLFRGPAKFSEEADDDLRMLGHALSIRLREVLREELGGVYGVSASGGISRRPRQRYSFRVEFACAPENVGKLRGKVMDEVVAIAKHGVAQGYLDKIKQTRVRGHETALKENGYWLGQLTHHYRYGEDPRKILDIDRWTKRISSQVLQRAAQRYLDPKKVIAGVLMPEGPPAPGTPKPPEAPPERSEAEGPQAAGQ